MSDLQRMLLELHDRLGEANRLDPEDRACCRPPSRIYAVRSCRMRWWRSPRPAPPADVLEGAAVRLEAEHPNLAGAVRAVVDALAKAGI